MRREGWWPALEFVGGLALVFGVIFAILVAGAGFGALTGWDMSPVGALR